MAGFTPRRGNGIDVAADTLSGIAPDTLMKSYTTPVPSADTQLTIDARFVAELFQTDKFITDRLFDKHYWGRVKDGVISEQQLREWIAKFNRFDVMPRLTEMLKENHRNNS